MGVGKTLAALAASAGLFAAAQSARATVQIEMIAPPAAPFTNQVTGITGKTNLAGDTRLFLTRKAGSITAYDQATGTFSQFRNLQPYVGGVATSSNELGLLGMAFDPGYATNGHYYVYLTGRTTAGGPVEAQVLRFTDPLKGSGGEASIWKTSLDGATNHVGGWIDFDASGKLLIAIGDGGDFSGPDSRGTGQDNSDFFGSILRIDPYADAFPLDSALNYAVPGDNPVLPGANPAPEVFVYGVRNPYRNTVAPDGSLIVADVGNGAREELTIVGATDSNRNLGWALREGDIPTPGGSGGAEPADYQAPDLAYGHGAGDRAIIGGFVYRGSAVPELFGHYVFGDQVSGNIWAIRYENGQFVGSRFLLGNIPSLVSFGETSDGELVATRFAFGAGGGIYRFTSDGNFAVPEPASWAMMILGLGLAGGLMRRRPTFQAARRVV